MRGFDPDLPLRLQASTWLARVGASARLAWVVRGVVAAAQCAAVVIVWPLWHARADPPNVAVVGALASVPVGAALVASALAFVVFPRAGSVAHALVLGVAMLGDQLRLLPEFLSLAVVMVALAWGEMGRVLGLAHLSSLWLWSGLNKALSPIWPAGSAQFVARSLGVPQARPWVAVLLPTVEIALGLAVAVPWLRRRWPTAVGAVGLHLGIVVTLALAWYNHVVWPWNLALAVAGPYLIRRSLAPPAPRPEVRARLAVAAIWMAFLLYPIGFYAGVVDTYLAHNLYTDNTASMQWCAAGNRCPAPAYTRSRGVIASPYPPEPRIFRAWFAARCEPGDTLRIFVPEVRVPRAGTGATTVACPR